MAKCFFTGEESKAEDCRGEDAFYYKNDIAKYWLDREASQAYSEAAKLNPKQNLNCIAETIKLNDEGLTPVWVVRDTGKEFATLPDQFVVRELERIGNSRIDHSKKENQILETLINKARDLENPFEFIGLTKRDKFKFSISNSDELLNWLCGLRDRGLINFEDQFDATVGQRGYNLGDNEILRSNYKITVFGWEQFHKEEVHGKKCFIAMAFTDNDRKVLPAEKRDVIKSACVSAGWEPLIVDEHEHNEGIFDKIISLIDYSVFVIADLTHQKGGVYLEAGYAKGVKIPVIYCVEKDELSKCHFDVKHLNIIVYENNSQLREKLENRIQATIK